MTKYIKCESYFISIKIFLNKFSILIQFYIKVTYPLYYFVCLAVGIYWINICQLFYG